MEEDKVEENNNEQEAGNAGEGTAEKTNTATAVVAAVLITIVVVVGLMLWWQGGQRAAAEKESRAMAEKKKLEQRIAALESEKMEGDKKEGGADTNGGAAANNGGNNSGAAANNAANNAGNNAGSGSGNNQAGNPGGESGESDHAAADHDRDSALYQEIGDSSGTYTMKIPADWKITNNEGGSGVRISEVAVESPDYKYRTDPNFNGPFEPIYFEEGVALTVSYLQNPGASYEPVAANVTSKTKTTVGGKPAQYFVFTEPSTFAGEIHEIHLFVNNDDLVFRFVFNKGTYPQGPDVIRQILDSVEF